MPVVDARGRVGGESNMDTVRDEIQEHHEGQQERLGKIIVAGLVVAGLVTITLAMIVISAARSPRNA